MPRRLLAALLTLTVTAGCSAKATASGFTDGKLDVVTAFYPLQFLSERVGGDAVTVSTLTKPGAEPHDLELNPRQVGQVADAGLAVYLRGFQPAVDTTVDQEANGRAFDVATAVEPLPATEDEQAEQGHAEEADHAENANRMDPHIWLGPVRFATIADRLGERLGKADPPHAADYTARAAALHAELDRLNTEFATGLKTCQRRELVTSHTAFHYLADRYGLTQVGVTGITPEAEPSAQRLAAVAARARETGTTPTRWHARWAPGPPCSIRSRA